MKMILHTPSEKGMLSGYYHQAFKESKELFIVTAYLTEWDETLELNASCRGFRLIVGKDFGITRKAACEAVMWTENNRTKIIGTATIFLTYMILIAYDCPCRE